MNLSPLAPLIDIIPERARKTVYGTVTILLAVVTLLPTITHVPAWLAALAGIAATVSGLLATANTNVKTSVTVGK